MREVLDRGMAGGTADHSEESTYSIATVTVLMSEAVAIRSVGADPVADRFRPGGNVGIAHELGTLSVLSGRCNTTPAGEGGLRSVPPTRGGDA